MRLQTLGYLIVESLVGLRKNLLMTLAAVSTVAICLMVSAVFLLLAANLGYISYVLESEIELIAYLVDDFDRDTWRDTLVAKINQTQGVDEVLFVTREDALDSLKDQFGEDEHLLEAVEEDNPLRDSVRISLSDLDQVDSVVESVKSLVSVAEVRYEREMVQRLLSFTEALRLGGLGVVTLLAGATFLVVSNTIRLTVYARREEIEIMKLVGATAAFIRLPFILEGMLIGLLGSGLAVGITWYGYTALLEWMGASLPFVPLLSSRPLLDSLALIILSTGVVLGFISSAFSLRRFLRISPVDSRR